MRETPGIMASRHRREIAAMVRQLADAKLAREAEYQRCRDFGGFCDREGIAEILGVSRERVGQLVRGARFRQWSGLFSLADVRAYAEARNPKGGRPKKPRLRSGRGAPDQFNLDLP